MLRRGAMLMAIGIGWIGMLAPEAVAHPHRHIWRPQAYTYRLNPCAEYRWFGPGFSFGVGDWGSAPSYFPYAHVWSRTGRPHDLACNMPSSPCWNEDRE